MKGPATASNKPRARPERRFRFLARHHRVGLHRLGGQKRGDHARPPSARHRRYRTAFQPMRCGDGQDHRFAHQQRDAIAEGVGGGQKPQLVRVAARFRCARRRWRCPGWRRRRPPPARRRPAAPGHGWCRSAPWRSGRRRPRSASAQSSRGAGPAAPSTGTHRSSNGAQRNFSE